MSPNTHAVFIAFLLSIGMFGICIGFALFVYEQWGVIVKIASMFGAGGAMIVGSVVFLVIVITALGVPSK